MTRPLRVCRRTRTRDHRPSRRAVRIAGDNGEQRGREQRQRRGLVADRGDQRGRGECDHDALGHTGPPASPAPARARSSDRTGRASVAVAGQPHGDERRHHREDRGGQHRPPRPRRARRALSIVAGRDLDQTQSAEALRAEPPAGPVPAPRPARSGRRGRSEKPRSLASATSRRTAPRSARRPAGTARTSRPGPAAPRRSARYGRARTPRRRCRRARRATTVVSWICAPLTAGLEAGQVRSGARPRRRAGPSRCATGSPGRPRGGRQAG